MSRTYNEENDILYKNYLQDYFFNDFLNPDPEKIKQLEIIVSPKCNLGCKYCYLHKYYNKSFPPSSFDESRTLENLDKLLNWLHENKYRPNLDIFSGELLAQKIGYQVLDRIYEFEKKLTKEERFRRITIPTNYTFINSDEEIRQVQKLIYKFSDLGIPLILSASFDGKYMDENRPYIHDLDITFNHEYSDEYYDKIFKFNKKNGFGFHPMVYSKNIDKWKQNFIWFQDMFNKYDIEWKRLYLLQVRNVEWTEYEIKCFKEFIDFLLEYSYDKCKKTNENFMDFIFIDGGFNILREPFTCSSKGLPCAMQTEFTVKLNDLTHHPCHRLLYDEFKIGEFVDKGNSIEFCTKNASLGLTILGCDKNMFPHCINCPINSLCIGGCLGAQYEVTGSMFIPIPTVCKVNLTLVKTIIDFFVTHDIYDELLTRMSFNNDKYEQIKYIKELEL